jgi:B-cell receptor-associated protein 31
VRNLTVVEAIVVRSTDPPVYLTGATLFLSLILSRVFYIILDFITVQEQFTALQTKSAKASGNAGESDELRKRIRALEAELGKSQSTDRDFGMPPPYTVEYNRLADEHNRTVSLA